MFKNLIGQKMPFREWCAWKLVCIAHKIYDDMDLDDIISIVDQHYSGSPYGKDLLVKLQALRNTYDLYPDVWVSTVRFEQGQPVERRADVWNVSSETFDELFGDDE